MKLACQSLEYGLGCTILQNWLVRRKLLNLTRTTLTISLVDAILQHNSSYLASGHLQCEKSGWPTTILFHA